jgi:hypothetical protein
MRIQIADGKAFELTILLLLAAVIALALVIGIVALMQNTAVFEVAGLSVDDPSFIPRLFSPWGIDANRFVI